MPARLRSTRSLPDGTPLHNRLLAALPRADYERILPYVRMSRVTVGDTLQAHRARIKDVYFPNGGVFSITNEMRNGRLVEVATVGREGMLGVGVFFGDRNGIGRTFQQVPNGTLPSMAVARFIKETAVAGPFRDVVGIYAQANLLQVMQCTACNALHDVSQRCCRWLLQIHDRVDGDDFALKQEFLAMMLGVQRTSVSAAAGGLQKKGLVRYRRGIVTILDRPGLKRLACECYGISKREFDHLLGRGQA